MTGEREHIARALLTEFRDSGDWVTLAAAVELFGTSSFVARKADLRPILECVNDEQRMYLISAHLRYRRAPKPIPVEALLNEIFAKSEDSDRAAAMMEYLVDIDDELNPEPHS